MSGEMGFHLATEFTWQCDRCDDSGEQHFATLDEAEDDARTHQSYEHEPSA